MSAEVSASLALALGRGVQAGELAWREVLEVSRRERLAPLAWLRSAPAIRAAAPPNVATAWRNTALSAVSLAEFWSRLSERTVGALQRAGVDAVVLKGLPLAQRLYGNIAARPCADLDLHVPIGQRSVAHEALLLAGWRWRIERAPREGAYDVDCEGRTAILEVHSTLLDDGLVSHLDFAPAGHRPAGTDGSLAASHGDDHLPAFLATHLAKHAMPPLLWFVDFSELWRSLTVEEQHRAWAVARGARAQRYLAWAIRRANDTVAVAGGDPKALQRLGFSSSGRADFHNAARVAALASTPMDALRVAANWLLPKDARCDWSSLVAHVGSRLRKPLRRALGTRRSYKAGAIASPSVPAGHPKILRVDATELCALVCDLTERDAQFTIRARGSSMRPSLESGTQVCLTPRRGRPLMVGSVVLAITAGGTPVLHRIVRTGDGWVQTQGDGNVVADLPLASRSVLAIADAVVVDGIERPIPVPRFRFSRQLARKVVAALGRRRRSLALVEAKSEASGE